MKPILIIVGLFTILTTSSCYKTWECTCKKYKLSFEDEFDPVTGKSKNSTEPVMFEQSITTASFKKKAKAACQDAESSGKQKAIDIGANPDNVSCKLN